MTSVLLLVLFGVLALLLAIGLAFVPLRLMMYAIARGAATRVREFIQRNRERRNSPRDTPDRRVG